MSSTPLLTVVVFAYKQAAFIDAAIDSALGQQGEPIEVLLSDDASPDDTYARMQAKAAAYQGPHQVVVRRNERNLGIGGHFNAVMEAARGEMVLIMAGDDISLPERAHRTLDAWESTGRRADLIASHVVDMSFEGEDLGVIQVADLAKWQSMADWCRERPYVIGAAHAISKRLFQRFGPMALDCHYEDQVNTLRAIAAGGACTIDAALVRYRQGGMSSAAAHRRAGPVERRALLRAASARHLAVHQQWHRDAALAGCLPEVVKATEREWHRERYAAALVAGPDHEWPALSLLWDRNYRVSAGWRLDKWRRVAQRGG
ncbi:MAG: glycosyl transferase family 2 [Ideonella sp. MAG2]|nr:MAG: glycosyl transferase family 2 [Ideonella sp. MAG2]